MVEGMSKAYGANLIVIVGQGNEIVRALHGVSYCRYSRIEPVPTTRDKHVYKYT
ncbi:MAG: hypothetical protein SCL54_15505 [Bacillota bacterium]|nr:hypothetical protein [Bacillota bacterium]